VAIQDHPVKIEPVYYPASRAVVLGAQRTVQTLALTVELPVLVLRGLVPADAARPVALSMPAEPPNCAAYRSASGRLAAVHICGPVKLLA